MTSSKRNGGKWTPARWHSFVVSALRSASRRYPPKFETLQEAYVGQFINPKTKRVSKHYRCAACQEVFPGKEVQIDHICAIAAVEGFTSWDSFVQNLFCEKGNLQCLCLGCHQLKSNEEKIMRKGFSSKEAEATYQCWLDMKQRCYNTNSQRYPTHGARGISVCTEWKNSYQTFLKDMGEKPAGLTLDRKDNNGNYNKENCRWATPKEQANNRSTCIYVEYNGTTKTVQQWAQEIGITHSSLMKRLRNWPIEKALSKESFSSEIVDEETKKEILDLLKTTELSQEKLAKLYGITQSAISRWVVKGKK